MKKNYKIFITVIATAYTFWIPCWVVAIEPEIEFRGIPQRITSVGCENTTDSVISSDKVKDFICLIHKIDGRYYWASRDNRELLKIQSGAFINYIALRGGGYIKLINPADRSAVAILGESEVKYDYVEHLMGFGLSSISYYGKESN